MAGALIPGIRRAREVDADGILRCLGEAFEPYRSQYTPHAYTDTVLTPETIRTRLETTSVFVAVGEGGEVVGTIGGSDLGGGEGHIRGMAVMPALHGQGVAARLLEAVEDELRALGCTIATLDTTEPLRRAARFYERHGYRASGRVTDFYGMPIFEYLKPLESERGEKPDV